MAMNEPNKIVSAPIPLDKCSVARALALIGDHWTLLILREAFYGVSRFEAMRADLGVPRTVLSQRLRVLVVHGIMQQVAYQASGQRTRFEYQLTQKGRALLPVLATLMEWGDHYLATDETPTLILSHTNCGARVTTRFVCEKDHVIKHMHELTETIHLAE